MTRADCFKSKIHDPKTRSHGSARHLIVTPEQLFKSTEGHFTRLGLLIRTCPDFRKRITRFCVDEAHHTKAAGMSNHGLPPFRPTWGRLGEIKALVPHAIWQGFSATMPTYILDAVESSWLRSKYVMIRTTLNQPNIIYARHRVHKSLQVLQNFECFLEKPFLLARQPNVLIFIENSDLVVSVARHLAAIIGLEYRGKNIVRHYHSLMSPEYLKQVHDEFVDSSGPCKILVTTSAEATVSDHV